MRTLNAKNCIWISDWSPPWNPGPSSSCKMLSWSHTLRHNIDLILYRCITAFLSNSSRHVNTSFMSLLLLPCSSLSLSNLDFYGSSSQNMAYPSPSGLRLGLYFLSLLWESDATEWPFLTNELQAEVICVNSKLIFNGPLRDLLEISPLSFPEATSHLQDGGHYIHLSTWGILRIVFVPHLRDYLWGRDDWCWSTRGVRDNRLMSQPSKRDCLPEVTHFAYPSPFSL